MFRYLLISCLFLPACNTKKHPAKPNKFLQSTKTTSSQGKARGFFQVSLTDSENEGGDIALKARVLARQSFSSPTARWQLPSHAKLVQGTPSETLALNAGEEHSFEITVDRDSIRAGDSILFSILQVSEGENHGATATFTYKVGSESDFGDNLNEKNHSKPKIME